MKAVLALAITWTVLVPEIVTTAPAYRRRPCKRGVRQELAARPGDTTAAQARPCATEMSG